MSQDFKAKFINKRLILPVIVIAIAIGIAVLLMFTRSKPDATPRQEKSWSVDVVKVQLGTHTPNIILYGEVESPRDAKLEAAVEADVAETLVKEGQLVKKGQLLIVLDDRDAKLLLTQREAEVEELQASIKSEILRYAADKQSLQSQASLVTLNNNNVVREQKLINQGIGSAVALDRAKEELQQAVINYNKQQLDVTDHISRLTKLRARLKLNMALRDKAKLDLERTKKYAPFGGRIAKLHVAVGDRVQPGEALIDMFDTNALELRVQLPSRYLRKVRNALAQDEILIGEAIVDGQPMELQLERLSGQVEKGKGGIDALFHIISGGKMLALGRTVEIILELSPVKNTIAIPQSAIYGSDTIYVVENNRLVPIIIDRLGYINQEDNKESLVLVNSPKLQNQMQVVITQLPNAIQGLKVKVVNVTTPVKSKDLPPKP